MPKFKKEYIVIGACVVLSLVMFTRRIACSDSSGKLVSAASRHEPFEISSGSSLEEDGGIKPRNMIPGLSTFVGMFGSSSSSPEDDAEDDILTETAIHSAPPHLSSKLGELRPYVKLLLRTKRSSPVHGSRDVVDALKRASSHQHLPQLRGSALASASAVNDSPEDEEPESAHLSPEIQRERVYIQQLLLEAAQTALEAKESELNHRSKLLHEKERKLDEKFSKKATAAIATIASVLTTLGGTLAAYYSSQCNTSK